MLTVAVKVNLRRYIEADSELAGDAATEIEERCAGAEQRAVEAEAALAAFKDEARVTLERKTVGRCKVDLTALGSSV